MTLAEFADLAEVIGALGVIASLVFVGYQLRQNTEQLKRAESNSAMTQASAVRLLMVGNRDAAQLFAAGIGGATLDPVDELRLNVMFSEVAYLLTKRLGSRADGTYRGRRVQPYRPDNGAGVAISAGARRVGDVAKQL